MSTSAEKVENQAQPEQKMIPIFVMGKRYTVPEDLTIMKAMEHVGYQFVRGCGCRMGVCGACGTVYRKPDDYRIRVALACQTVVEENMYLVQIPFFPANRAVYNLDEAKGRPEEVFQAYPELFRCVACNACTKVCPVEVKVMDYISAIKRGALEEACEISFDCIQCGLCTSRCMGELPQYHIAQMVRRLVGAKLTPTAQHNLDQRKAIAEGLYQEVMDELVKLDTDALKKLYQERQWEPAKAGEEWRPEVRKGLL